ncbi:glycoside hydrolase family 99-like domain-containing protein [Methylocystis sp. JAN1]|uniref:glycoside hydrolase family 99-like domain-containing protein n=1 Tax=Methylocystis sp. JAN1 TaxID=3397211 RepID=UPI003FA31122
MSRGLLARRIAVYAPILIFLCGSASAEDADQSKLVWDLMRHETSLTSIYRYQADGNTFFGQRPQGDQNLSRSPIGEAFAVISEPVAGALPLYRFTIDKRLSYVASWLQPPTGSKLLGFIFARPSPGLLPLKLVCSTQATNCTLATGSPDSAAGDAIGYVFPRARPFRIGAYYFGMFSPEAWGRGKGRIAERIAKFYGKGGDDPYWWAGVRDFYEGRLPEALESEYPAAADFFHKDWSRLKPEIGWYNQRDPRTLERHIEQATSNGVSFFNFYWYWDADLGDEALNDGLNSFLEARNGSDMDFMLSICEHGWRLSIPAEQYDRVAGLLVRKYLSKPNYLHDGVGRPILQLCDANGIRSGDSDHGSKIDIAAAEKFVASIRSEAKTALDEEVDILVRMDSKDAGELRKSAIFDGGSCVAPVLDRRDLAANYAMHPGWFAKVAQGWPFMPCFNERMDERPRVGIMKPPEEIFFFEQAADPGTFAVGLRAVKTWMDQRKSEDLSRFLAIYAWNEWHEGGVLEPTKKDGAALIREIPQVFQTPTLSPRRESDGK